MVRHVVLMRFREESPRQALEAVVQGLMALTDQIPEIRAMSAGADIRLTPNSCDLAIVVDFATADDYLIYADHPAHRRVVQELIDPHVVERHRAQIVVAD